ncbi:MAG: TolC family protein [Gemmatimonadetes bacterium]|nr:TolC family protein [Gemmatimonadota bacterium]
MQLLSSAAVRRAISRLSLVSLAVLPAPCAAQATPTAPPASGPLTLRQVFDLAASQPLLQAARARVRAAGGSRATAGAFGNPVLSYQVENAPLSANTAPSVDREVTTTALLPLEPLYQRGPRVQRADAAVRAAGADVVSTRQRLLVDAARAYHRTGVAQEGAAVARDLLAWLDSLVSYNRARAREGAAAEADLLRAELERDRAEADLAMQEADLARARADLAVYVGDEGTRHGARRVTAITAPFTMPVGANQVAVPDSADRLRVIHALAVRADVRGARERVTAAEAGVSGERAMLVRQLRATVGTRSGAGNTYVVAGLSVPLPLFDRNRGEIERASGERDAALLELAATERGVRADVVGAFDAAQVLTARAGSLARPDSSGTVAFLAKADEARRIALGAYREGAIPLIQVLDAARAWGDSHATYVRLIAAQRDSIVALLAALGVDLATWDMSTLHASR